jgi:uncharacterized protein
METEMLDQYALLYNLLEYWEKERLLSVVERRVRLKASEAEKIESLYTIAGLVPVGGLVERFGKPNKKYPDGRPLVGPAQSYSFPKDQLLDGSKFASGSKVQILYDNQPSIWLEILEFDQRKGIISLKWNPPEPEFNSHNVTTVAFVDYVPPAPKPQALFSFVENWLQNPESESVTNALLRGDKPSYSMNLEEDASLENKISHLDNSYIVIQGPPGTGKTYTGARLIHHLIKVEGKRVGITAQSWNAIDLLLEETVGVFNDKESLFAVRKKGSGDTPKEIEGVDYRNGKPDDFTGYNLVASTTWFWANKDFNEDNRVDYLVVDEAGQLALADALSASKGANNLVLIGDPQQLSQVTQASHLCGAGASVLEHVMGDSNVVAEDQGKFLNITYRLRPEIRDFISEEFYDARLESDEICEERSVDNANGLFWVPVTHENDCVNESEEEAVTVLKIIQDLIGTDWTYESGKSKQLEPQDFMVVAPYNAQVNKIKRTLLEAKDLKDVTKDNVWEIVGTVDRFQGKEAPVVIYSLTTSRQDLMPRGRKGDFLFSPNRLNVAVSRAKCLAYMVGTEELMNTHASSISEMKALNHFCRYVDDLSVGEQRSVAS